MKRMEFSSVRDGLLLLLTACIWGVAFVAQSAGMDYVGPYTFNGARFFLGGFALLPLIYARGKRGGESKRYERKTQLVGGLLCGIALCTASTFQQFGIQATSVGKAGFITALYIILVPILGLFLRKKVRPLIWVGALMAVVGLYLLCMQESLTLNRGDVLVFICAVLFAVHILVVDYYAPKTDSVKLSCEQFFVSAIICTLFALWREQPTWSALLGAAVPILYAGIFSSGVGYTLQIVGQRHVDSTVASLIMSLESVISVLAAWVILGQKLSTREFLGCGVVFAAVILVQLPEKKI